MTAREKQIWIVASGVIGLVLVYNLGFGHPEQMPNSAQSKFGLAEARRLLRAGPRIMARAGATTENLRQLQSHFLPSGQPSSTKLKLLRLVEELAVRSGLSTQLKNTVAYSQTELGVSLEGTAAAETIVRFLQQLTTAPLDLKVKRLQLHSMPEQKVLNYQIAVSTLVVD